MTAFFNQKYAASALLCLLVAISRPASIEAYTMNETCAYIPKGYIGDPTNCQNWGYCSGGLLIATGSCKSGLLFDTRSSMCNYANQVSCQTTVQDICNSATQPGYIADPNNCNRYCYCAQGRTTCYTCPQYQSYNPTTNTCVWSRNYNCPANSICRLVANNVFAGDPSICGNYIRCQDGSGTSLACGNSLLYNPIQGNCDSTYSCNASPGGNTNSNSPAPPTNTAICADEYVTTTNGVQYFTDSTTCYGYYSCTSKTATGIWGSCPFATHFNPQLQKCVTPYTYACPYDRCGNLNLPFVATTGCAGYAVCRNGVTQSKGTCAEVTNGFNWFDEYGGGCVATKPTETICN